MVTPMLIRKLTVSSLLLLLILALVRCGFPESFQGISWNSEFKIPLLNRFYHIFELEEESANFFIEENEFYIIYEDSVESTSASSEIKLNPGSSEITQVAGAEEGTLITVSVDESGIDTEDIDLIYGILEEGTISIEIIDPRPELEELNITFLSILDEVGEPLQVDIADFGISSYHYDIAHYSIGSQDGGEIIDELEFYVETTSQEFFYDLVYLRIFFENPLYFHYFEGYLVEKKVNLNEHVLDNDINNPVNISNAFQFEEGILEMTFINELGFDGQFVGTFTGFNYKDNKTYSLDITREDDVFLNRAIEAGVPETTTVLIDKPEVIDLINIFPEKMRLENAYMMLGNRDETPGFAYAADKSSGNFKITTPAFFRVSNETIIPDEVFSLQITENNRDYIDEYTESLSLFLTMENTLPLGLSVDLYFSESPDTLNIYNPEASSGIQTIKFADNYVSASFIGSEPTVTSNEFLLEREDIELFLNETVYYALKITFDESEGSIRILPEHYMQVIGQLNVNLNMEIE